MHVTILGKRFKLEFVPSKEMARGQLGECSDPNEPQRVIRINQNCKGRLLTEVLIHECLHAADWHKDEEWVERVATDIERVLHRVLGDKGRDANGLASVDAKRR